MHKLLLAAIAATTLLGAVLLPGRADAISLGGAAVGSTEKERGLITRVDRVCRQFCDDGYCRTRCFYIRDRDDDDRYRYRFRDRDRDWDRDRDRDRFRDRDRDRDCDRVGPVVVCH